MILDGIWLLAINTFASFGWTSGKLEQNAKGNEKELAWRVGDSYDMR